MPLAKGAAKARGLIHSVAPRYDMYRLRQTWAYFSGTASVADLQSLLSRSPRI